MAFKKNLFLYQSKNNELKKSVDKILKKTKFKFVYDNLVASSIINSKDFFWKTDFYKAYSLIEKYKKDSSEVLKLREELIILEEKIKLEANKLENVGLQDLHLTPKFITFKTSNKSLILLKIDAKKEKLNLIISPSRTHSSTFENLSRFKEELKLKMQKLF